MRIEDRIWNVLGILVVVIVMAVPLSITIKHFEQGGMPLKNVTLSLFGPTDPLSELMDFSEGSSLNLFIGEKPIDNILIWQMYLENTGKSPIAPKDFFKKLRVDVHEPWIIMGVSENKYLGDKIHLKWKKLNPNSMEASPFLFNPGDKIAHRVYLTYEGPPKKYSELKKSKPIVSARILNLKGFSKEKIPFGNDFKRSIVDLSLGEILFLLTIASLFLYWYIQLLNRNGFLTNSINQAAILIIIVALISYSTAEVITYYILGQNSVFELLGGRTFFNWQYQFLNWIILATHCTMSLALFIRIRSKKK